MISTTGVLDTDGVNNVRFNNLEPATLYEIELLQGSEVISSTRIVTSKNSFSFGGIDNEMKNIGVFPIEVGNNTSRALKEGFAFCIGF